jgi:hypothetical protein
MFSNKQLLNDVFATYRAALTKIYFKPYNIQTSGDDKAHFIVYKNDITCNRIVYYLTFAP